MVLKALSFELGLDFVRERVQACEELLLSVRAVRSATRFLPLVRSVIIYMNTDSSYISRNNGAYRSARASPYADKIELYRCTRIVLIPSSAAISHACCPPAPPKLANLEIRSAARTCQGKEAGQVNLHMLSGCMPASFSERPDGPTHCLICYLDEAV